MLDSSVACVHKCMVLYGYNDRFGYMLHGLNTLC